MRRINSVVKGIEHIVCEEIKHSNLMKTVLERTLPTKTFKQNNAVNRNFSRFAKVTGIKPFIRLSNTARHRGFWKPRWNEVSKNWINGLTPAVFKKRNETRFLKTA